MNETTGSRDRAADDRSTVLARDAGPTQQPSPWAPWWVYLVVILGGNLLRAQAMNDRDLSPVIQVAAALGLAAVLALIVTVGWRIMQGGRR